MDAVAAAHVERDRSSTRWSGDRAITLAVTGFVGRFGSAGPRSSPTSLRSCSFSCSASCAGRRLAARLDQFGLQAVVFAAGIEGLVEPADQVAGGLQRPVGDRLERAEDRADAALQAAELCP